MLIDCRSKGSLTENDHAGHSTRKPTSSTEQGVFFRTLATPVTTANWHDVIGRVTTYMLPDLVLLEIFHFYVDQTASVDVWQTLVHVCRKWRNIVYASPRRLHLQLICSNETPVRETLDVWPSLPIIMKYYDPPASDVDNVVAALEHHDRLCEVTLWDVPSPQLKEFSAVMKEPCPALTHLWLKSNDDEAAPVHVIPDSFLGGSAPRLRLLFLRRVPFPGLPKLLLSATGLVHLELHNIPQSGHILPATIATCISTSTGLKRLALKFESPRSHPLRASRRPPPQSRSVLPALIDFSFTGVSEYLEDLMARIDAPLLSYMSITFFHQLILHTPQLTQFISRTPTLKLNDQTQARVLFSGLGVSCVLPRIGSKGLLLGVSCRQSDWQLSSLSQVCTWAFPQALIQMVENLYIQEDTHLRPRWQDDIETSDWLEILQPFMAVKNLYLSKEFAPRIAPSLQELVGQRATQTLPALQSLFAEDPHPSGPVQEDIGKFVAARQVSDHPIAISSW
jgi:hypothetical protein